MTKSVTTTLLGIAIDQGRLSLDDPVLSFFPGRTIAHRDARKERLTVGDLASMTSGLDCVAQPNEPTLAAMDASPDPVQFTLDLPMVAEPGTTWEYCSPGMHLLSAILTKATGMTELDFAWASLFGPLGMRDVIWPADPQGFTHGWGDLMLRPEDAAKLGQLWLNGGEWQGRRIVSAAWVKAAATSHATTSEQNLDYGYGWWLERQSQVGGQFEAHGRGGQSIVVFPALASVAAITGGGSFGIGDVLNRIAPALVDPQHALPPNPTGVSRLRDTIARLRAAPQARSVAPAPKIAGHESGTVYRIAANPLGITSLRLDNGQPDEHAATLMLETGTGPLVTAIGLDGVDRFSPGQFGLPIAARGAWEGEDRFVAEVAFVANIDTYQLDLRFSGDTVTVMLVEQTSGAKVTLRGTAMTPGASPAATPAA